MKFWILAVLAASSLGLALARLLDANLVGFALYFAAAMLIAVTAWMAREER